MSNQKVYSFTLILGNVDQNTPHLEDKLYEAGCDDALINFRDGTVYLDFDREANSLEEAVLEAIKDVETSSIDAKVISVAPENLVTESEAAKRLDVKRQTVSLWIKGERRASQPFPKPIMKLCEKSPLWSWVEIVEWVDRNEILDNKMLAEELMQQAIFFENLQVALSERGKKNVQASRRRLIQKLETLTSNWQEHISIH